MDYPLWKNPIFFDFFNLLILWSLKEVFASKILCNTFSWSILTKIKRMDQLPIFDQDRGLCTFEKSQFFDFFKLLVFYSPARKALFHSRISWNALRCPILPKTKKNGKIANFLLKPGTNPFKKMLFFRLFLTSCFYCLRRRFFFLEYHKTHISSLFQLK